MNPKPQANGLDGNCKAMVLTEYIGGKRKCKRSARLNRYCYHHNFLSTYTGYYIDRNFKKGVVE